MNLENSLKGRSPCLANSSTDEGPSRRRHNKKLLILQSLTDCRSHLRRVRAYRPEAALRHNDLVGLLTQKGRDVIVIHAL